MKQITQIPSLPPRPKDSHKGLFGRILIVAGSVGMAGAAGLSAKATLRSGAGVVKVATAKSVGPIVSAMEMCAMTVWLTEDDNGRISKKAIDTILQLAGKNDIVVLGPGLGVSDDLKFITEKLIKEDIKLVIDADGLNNLASLYKWQDKAEAKLIVTPHPGEMKRLWKSVFREAMPDDRVLTAGKFAQETASTVVLKGFETVVCNGSEFYTNTTGNPGMATAGSGDVLAGMIAGLWAVLPDATQASILGVFSHGTAGDKAAEIKGQVSMIASDIIDCINFI